MSGLQGLSRVPIHNNKNYKPSGIKSYGYSLQKWGFEPTKAGPLSLISRSNQHGVKGLIHKIMNRTSHCVLAKKPQGCAPAPGSGSAPTSGSDPTSGTGSGSAPTPDIAARGEVPAEDIQFDAFYLSEVDIGTPPQTLRLNFDTGSADLWVWSTKLPRSTTSRAAGHTIFDPAKSSTFKDMKGSRWSITYGDGSSASGTVGTDNVTIGGLTIELQAVELASRLSTSFVQSAGDGILGLAFGSINTVTPTAVATPVENMITQQDIPKTAELFTAKLGSWRDANEPDMGESFYTFGYIDQATVTASGQEISYTPVDNSQGFWMVDSASATVMGKTITQTGNTAIVDTGTTLALVSDLVCETVYAAIPGSTYDSRNQGYVFPSSTTASQLPVVTFAIGNKQFVIQKEDLGFADAGNGMVYGGIQSRGTLPFDILGDTFLKAVYAIFDQGNTRFGAVQRLETAQNTNLPPT